MSSYQIVDRLGSAAFTIAVLSLLLLFVPGLVRAETVCFDACSVVSVADNGSTVCRADL